MIFLFVVLSLQRLRTLLCICKIQLPNSDLGAKDTAAKLIANTREIKFTPVLQPVIFYGNPSIDHLNKSLIGDNLKDQFDSVYPKLIERLNSINFEYLNLINIFDEEEIYYIDFMHFSPNGNKKIANLISELYFE